MEINNIIGLLGSGGIFAAFVSCALVLILSILDIAVQMPKIDKRLNTLVHIQTIILGISVLSLAILLLSNAFEYPLVFSAVETSMPWIQKLGGLWSGQSASLLFWAFIMSLATSISIMVSKQNKKINYAPYLCFVLEFTLLFFIAPNVFYTHPFEKTWILADGTNIAAQFPPLGATLGVPLDGIGLNPSLRHPSMLLHPPFLYLGLIFFFIPYAFSITSLMTGDKGDQWIRMVFPFALLAWIFLTIGMFLGSWWAYTILGWGGFWSWDAVEISGLLPWLLSFGLIHSLRVHLNGHSYKNWIAVLSSLIILLILFGILLTRSGIIESIHAYVSGAMGPLLTVLILVHLILGFILLLKRWENLSKKNGLKFSPLPIKLVSLFNFGLILLAGLFLFGQTLPLTSQFLLPEKMNFTAGQYESFSSPLFILLVVITALFPISRLARIDFNGFKRSLFALMFFSSLITFILYLLIPISVGIAVGTWSVAFLAISWLYSLWNDFISPVLLKRKNTGGIKKRIAFGAILIHLAFALLSVGIIGVINFSSHQDQTIRIGEETKISGETYMVSSSKNYISNEGRIIYEVQLIFADQSGRNAVFNPSIEYYPKMDSFYAKPSLKSGFQRDVQIILKTLPNSSDDKFNFRISIFPLMSWIWMGGMLLVIGGLITLIQKN